MDPNRVLDQILEAFESNISNLNYIELIEMFNKSAIPHFLGFKFKIYTNTTQLITFQNLATVMQSDKSLTPHNLFLVAANLIKRKILKIEDIWSHLSPTDQAIEELFFKKFDLANKHYKNVFTIKLKQDSEQKKKAKEQELLEYQEIYNQAICNFLLSLFFRIPLLDNQKFWLLEALVHINAWDDFESVYQIFSHHIILQSHNPTLTQLLNLLEWMIDPLYKQVSPCRFIRRPQKSVDFIYESSIPNGQIPQGKSFHDLDFYRNLSRIFKILQSAIGESPIVFVKLCRLFKGYLKNPSPEPETHTEILNHLQSIMGKFLLPGMTLFKCNPGVVTEFWIAFQEIEYKTRYYYYNEWITNVQFSNPILVEKVVQTLNEINKWLKRLAKDKIKHNGRTLGKLSHNNPVFIFNEIIKSVKSYPNQITSMIGALNYSSNLSLDINLFTVLRHVSDSGKEKLKQNDANLEGWLINLASYTGLFLRKNYNVYFFL